VKPGLDPLEYRPGFAGGNKAEDGRHEVTVGQALGGFQADAGPLIRASDQDKFGFLVHREEKIEKAPDFADFKRGAGVIEQGIVGSVGILEILGD
jgi:hypothetical protein